MFSGVSPYLAAHHVLQGYQKLCEGCGDMTPIKLIKLVYIAHGYHLAIAEGSPLIDTRVEAWQYGPVVPEIYYGVKDFKKCDIPADLFAGYTVLERWEDKLPDDSRQIVDDVLKAYGKHDGLVLSAATHKKGTPWHQVYKKEGRGAIIPNSVIRPYYQALMRK